MLKLRQGRRASLKEAEPSLPGWVNELLAGFLQTAPASRIQSASQAAAMLEKCVLHVQSPEKQLPPVLLKRHWLTSLLVAASVAGLVGLSGLRAAIFPRVVPVSRALVASIA